MKKQDLASIMRQSWQFIKRNGFTKSEALKTSWANYKLKKEMSERVVKFYYQKVDGSMREAYGTLMGNIVPKTKGTGRRANDTLYTYFDTEKVAWRSFKKANLISIRF